MKSLPEGYEIYIKILAEPGWGSKYQLVVEKDSVKIHEEFQDIYDHTWLNDHLLNWCIEHNRDQKIESVLK